MTRRRKEPKPDTRAPEEKVKADVLVALVLLGCIAIRTNAGKAKRGAYWFQLAPKGTSDICACAPDGRFVAVETKAPKGGPTPEQRKFLSDVLVRGGIAIVAHSAEEFVSEWDRQYFKARMPRPGRA